MDVLSHPAVSIAEIFVMGWAMLSILGITLRGQGLRALAIVWVTGSLVTGLTVLACGFAESLGAARVCVGCGVAGFVAIRVLRRPPRADVPGRGDGQISWVFTITLVAMAVWLVFGWVRIADAPLGGDESHVWAARAHLAVESSGFGADYAKAAAPPAFTISHPDYPPLNPLLQVWMMIGREPTDRMMRWPIQLFDLAALFFLAGALLRLVHPWAAAAIVAGSFLTSWYALPSALADRMIGLGLLMAVDGATTLLSGSDDRNWVSLPLGLALMTVSKHEGAALSLVLLLAIVLTLWLARPRLARSPGLTWRLGAAFGGAAIPVAAIWWWNQSIGVDADLLASVAADGSEGLAARLDRLVNVVGWAFRDFILAPSTSGLLLVLALAASVLRRSRLRRVESLVPALTALGGTAMFILVFVFSPHGLLWHWETAGARVLSDLNLVSALWAGSLLAQRSFRETTSSLSR